MARREVEQLSARAPARARRYGTAARTDGEDAHGVGVGLAEDAAQAGHALRHLERHHLRVHRQPGRHAPLDAGLDGRDLGVAQRPPKCKIEARALGGHQRAALVAAGAEHLAQAQVEHVRRRVVARDRRAPRVVHLRADRLPNF